MGGNGRARLAVTAALVAAMLATTSRASTAPSAHPSSPPAVAASARMPDALLPRLNASLAADDPAYAIAASPDDATTLLAANPAHGLGMAFAPGGVTLDSGGSAVTLRPADAVAVVPVPAGQRVEYRRGNLTEWYLNGPLGVEQGFTLTAPPDTRNVFTLTTAVRGATPHLNDDAVSLTLPDGSALTYGHLAVTDATGKRLPARLSVAGDAITTHADLSGAAYPVTVDPLVQQKKLTASDGAANDYFGTVAMSGDGTKVIVGAFAKKVGANGGQGAAYVYSGVNYATEKKLVASDGTGLDYFGSSVAMSADGAKVIIGANNKDIGANNVQGAAYIYSGVNYATEKKLTASDGAAFDAFGTSVGMSSDGATVIVGAQSKMIGANNTQGAAYVYSGANYSVEKKLTASDGAVGDYFGSAAAMSEDGATVIIGVYQKKIGTNTAQGAAYIYSGSNYTTEKRLVASDGAASDNFGSSVAMSADGAKVIIGATSKKIGANTQQGAAYIYSGANYATEKKLTASDGAMNDAYGSVAMSGDGTTVIVGARGKTIGSNPSQGAVYIYSGANYAIAQRVTASDGASLDSFGIPVAASNDGTKVIIGAALKKIGANDYQGAAYVFAVTTPPNPLPPLPAPAGPPQAGPPAPLPNAKAGSGSGNPNPLPQARP